MGTETYFHTDLLSMRFGRSFAVGVTCAEARPKCNNAAFMHHVPP